MHAIHLTRIWGP